MTLLQSPVAVPSIPTPSPAVDRPGSPTRTRARGAVLAVLGLVLASAAFGAVVDGHAVPADQAQVSPAGR